MKRFIFYIKLVLLLSLLYAVTGCTNKKEGIVFDSSSESSIDPEIKWAVVVDPYTACRNEHSYSALVTAHYRKGIILQVLGEADVKIDDKWEKWFAFDKGWIPGTALDISSNRLRAETVAGSILSKEN